MEVILLNVLTVKDLLHKREYVACAVDDSDGVCKLISTDAFMASSQEHAYGVFLLLKDVVPLCDNIPNNTNDRIKHISPAKFNYVTDLGCEVMSVVVTWTSLKEDATSKVDVWYILPYVYYEGFKQLSGIKSQLYY